MLALTLPRRNGGGSLPVPLRSGGYVGTFHHYSPKHLHRYINEFSGRHNIRPEDTMVQMAAIARGLVGKRLPYQDLIAEGPAYPR